MSLSAKDILADLDAWREKYWDAFSLATTTKLPDWEQENEYRALLYGLVQDFKGPSSRKLKYRFGDLQGVIFGIKTSPADKLEILRIIDSKCRKEGRADFEFYQAYYSPRTAKIEAAKLTLLKFGSSPSPS